MAANFPGAGNAVPGVFTQTETLSRGVSVPSGTRLSVIIGEGAREETLVNSAVGDRQDGLNPSFTSTSGSDGRHFLLSNAPIISNRTRLFKNGVELSVLEGTVDGSAFNDRFDAKVDISNGQIELQTASLVDQGGEFFKANSSNVGNGTINGLSLVDKNAPTETWTIKVSSTRKDGYGDPIDGYAKFIARGSESGIILDGYGNQIVWRSDGATVSNGILSFSISEGSTTFREGDSFTVQVESGTLVQGDSLEAIYIAEADINDPELFTDPRQVQSKHGSPSLTNTLALGAQIHFANGSPGFFALQAAPSIPRRQSFILEENASGEADSEDLSFALPLDVVPDADSNINFFLTDPSTGEESQFFPNKVDFFDATITSNPDSFHFGVSFDFSYTVILTDSVQKEGSDGVIKSQTSTTATLSSDSVFFGVDEESSTRTVKIFNATNSQNNGTFSIDSVSNGVMTISSSTGFVDETGVEFQILDSSADSARVLFTDDLALEAGASLRATVVDQKDADFFDANWTNAYAAAEKINVSMVVPLPRQTKSAIFQSGKSHVTKMSNIKNRRERILLTGAIQGLEPENVLGTELAAVENIGVLEGIQGDEVSEVLAGETEDLTNFDVQDAFGNSFRVVFFYPDEIVVQIGGSRQKIDGFYIAPAAAGFFSGTPSVNTPLTNKTLTGFSILRDKLFSPITIENIVAGGITLLQPVSGGGNVVWGKTTTTSGFAEEEEISIIFIRDRISASLRGGFRGFVGKAETPTLQQTLFARATAIMQAFLSQRLITDFSDLSVERDATEPRQWNITVAVQPVFPVNWIFIRINVGI